MHFLDSMGARSSDQNLCLREFSKPLTCRVNKWYIYLDPC